MIFKEDYWMSDIFDSIYRLKSTGLNGSAL